MAATFIPNPAGIAALATGPDSPVMRDLARRGEAVLGLARTLLARSEYTGELDGSLGVRIVEGAVGIGSDLPQCLYLHNGTGPMHITSDGGTGSVADPRAPYRPPARDPRFAGWARDHGWNPYTFALHVFTYGTAPIPFLRNALEAARI
jgi:hypothetical protein